VAALTAAAASWVAASVGARWVTVAYVYLVGMLAVLFITDLDHKRIPNRITYPGTPIGLALLATGAFLDGTAAGLGRALGGGIVYAAFFLIVFLVARGGLGFGDVKLALPIGAFSAFLGWERLLLAGLVTAAVGGVMAVATLLWGRGGLRAEIPYGPAMIVGGVVAIAAGEFLAVFLWA
jgi:leader peptidase (prepilin peptidase)/N-methyltransferase